MAETQRGMVDNVVPGDAPHCGTCRYYELMQGGSPVMEAMRALGQVHTCLRFKDTVTGELRSVQCVDARADERLCGAVGKLWSARVDQVAVSEMQVAQANAGASVAQTNAGASVGEVVGVRRGRPPKLKANSVDTVLT